MAAQAFSFTKIIVEDLPAAQNFYTQVLGLQVAGHLDLGEGKDLMNEVILRVAGAQPHSPYLILVNYPNRTCPAPGEATTGFVVDDLDAILAEAVAAGGGVEFPAADLPEHGLRVAYISDPQGHRIELLQVVGS